ncbi:predicted protein [Plenodomus lingam JN3]|uniref:Predicted protein n=1 Tax=Leptosphaeria maculans (strain JN3 / isolate v23.1.3 / race Av1-4-5-6-7-8) TaxID=985895 RepID=E4ZLE2_LEPMJ|nr:predicted protein [Plenodomus lingam JN3]CBX92301.1 predicted protein [Plenodomus lingam JN3]
MTMTMTRSMSRLQPVLLTSSLSSSSPSSSPSPSSSSIFLCGCGDRIQIGSPPKPPCAVDQHSVPRPPPDVYHYHYHYHCHYYIIHISSYPTAAAAIAAPDTADSHRCCCCCYCCYCCYCCTASPGILVQPWHLILFERSLAAPRSNPKSQFALLAPHRRVWLTAPPPLLSRGPASHLPVSVLSTVNTVCQPQSPSHFAPKQRPLSPADAARLASPTYYSSATICLTAFRLAGLSFVSGRYYNSCPLHTVGPLFCDPLAIPPEHPAPLSLPSSPAIHRPFAATTDPQLAASTSSNLPSTLHKSAPKAYPSHQPSPRPLCAASSFCESTTQSGTEPHIPPSLSSLHSHLSILASIPVRPDCPAPTPTPPILPTPPQPRPCLDKFAIL